MIFKNLNNTVASVEDVLEALSRGKDLVVECLNGEQADHLVGRINEAGNFAMILVSATTRELRKDSKKNRSATSDREKNL